LGAFSTENLHPLSPSPSESFICGFFAVSPHAAMRRSSLWTASLNRSASNDCSINLRDSTLDFSGVFAKTSKRSNSSQLGPPVTRSGSTL